MRHDDNLISGISKKFDCKNLRGQIDNDKASFPPRTPMPPEKAFSSTQAINFPLTRSRTI